VDESSIGVEAQLAVLRTKMDQLIELNKSRGEDHETRIRTLENARPDYITRKATVALVLLVCTVVTAVANFVALWIR
jgi:hypothetical protein